MQRAAAVSEDKAISTTPPLQFRVVIPAYNHAATLKQVVLGALESGVEVMVVDDGSTDETHSLLKELPVHVIRHAHNKGKGAAILTALHACREEGATHMVTLDADGQHDPKDVLHFITAIKKNPHAILVGNRNFSPATTPRISRFGRRFSNFWFRLQTGGSLKDTQCGFRAYPVMVLSRLHLTERHFSFEIEVLVKAAWAGVPLQDVAISVYYPKKSERVSHFHPLADNLRLTILNTRLTLRSMVPWPHRQIHSCHPATPKISLRRPVESMHLLLKQDLSPNQLARSTFLGVFLGTLPIIGFHTIAILFTAGYFRLSKVTAVASSQLCMPPLVPALCIEIGYYLRHGAFLTEISIETIGYQGLERIMEWLLGSLVLAPAISLAASTTVYFSALVLKKRIDARLQKN